MKYNLSISEAAEKDIRETFLWYEEQKEKLGFRFKKEIYSKIETIIKNPSIIQIRYNQIRVIFLKTFPYGIHFNVSGSEIMILAVFHTSMNPKRWEV